jgi:hypothetical protein
MEYYTYAYLREDGSPYYIGMGKGIRIHKQHPRGIQDLRPPRERRVKLKTNLTRQDAIEHEKELIKLYGRKDNNTGILHNLTDGGEGASGAFGEKYATYGTLGKKMSDKTRQRMSEGKRRWWLFKHKDGRELRVFITMKQFCLDNGLDRSTMMKVMQKKPMYHQHKGWYHIELLPKT